MKTKEFEKAFEDLTNNYTKEMLSFYSVNGEDYKQTKEAHQEFITNMKLAYYELLKKYNIIVSEDGPYAEQCNYVEKLLSIDDEKKNIEKQKALMAECAKYAFDISSDSRDENESDEKDAKNRKIRPSQAVKEFKSEARDQLYTYASTFEFLANDFYTENIDNLMHFLSTRNIDEQKLYDIHDELTHECRLLSKTDVDKYYEMILKDSNRSFSDLESKQQEMFNSMERLVQNKDDIENPFEAFTPEERKIHEQNVKQAFEEKKAKIEEDKDLSPFEY